MACDEDMAFRLRELKQCGLLRACFTTDSDHIADTTALHMNGLHLFSNDHGESGIFSNVVIQDMSVMGGAIRLAPKHRLGSTLSQIKATERIGTVSFEESNPCPGLTAVGIFLYRRQFGFLP